MSRDESSHFPLPTASERRMRDDAGETGATVVAYQGGGGEVLPVPGDRKFPFVMVPPDLRDPTVYVSRPLLPENVAAYDASLLNIPDIGPATGPVQLQGGYATELPIDVRGLRQLTMFVSVVLPITNAAALEANALSILPQAGLVLPAPVLATQGSYTPPDFDQAKLAPNIRWFSIGVVDPTMRGMFPVPVTNPEKSIEPPLFAFRNVYQSELVLPFLARDTVPTPQTEIHTTLVFDVAPYAFFRLRWAFRSIQRLGPEPTQNPAGTLPSEDVTYIQIAVQGQR